MTLFGLLALGLLTGFSAYLGRRIGGAFPRFKALIWGLLAAQALLLPLSFTLMRAASRAPWQPFVSWPAYLLFGCSTLLFAGVASTDLLILLARLPDVVRRARGGAGADRFDPARRRLFAGVGYGATLALGAGATVLGYREARRLAAVVEIEVPIVGLPRSLVGLRVAQLSDVHIGPTITGEYLRAVVERVNALGVDLVAVTGDLMDGTVEALGAEVSIIGDLRSRHGTFFVTGNHEYYSGAEAWLEALRGYGLRTLVNEHVVLEHDGETVVVAGVTDLSAERMMPTHRSDPAAAIRGAPPAALRLLLAHQPRSALAAVTVEGGFHLQLSGHTHAGQYFPWTLLIGLVQPFAAGLNKLGEMWIYTNRGTGYWGPPNRMGVPAEITLLRLVSA